jgi:hypothetical protein
MDLSDWSLECPEFQITSDKPEIQRLHTFSGIARFFGTHGE